MTKKITLFLLAAISLLSFSACHKEENPAQPHMQDYVLERIGTEEDRLERALTSTLLGLGGLYDYNEDMDITENLKLVDLIIHQSAKESSIAHIKTMKESYTQHEILDMKLLEYSNHSDLDELPFDDIYLFSIAITVEDNVHGESTSLLNVVTVFDDNEYVIYTIEDAISEELEDK